MLIYRRSRSKFKICKLYFGFDTTTIYYIRLCRIKLNSTTLTKSNTLMSNTDFLQNNKLQLLTGHLIRVFETSHPNAFLQLIEFDFLPEFGECITQLSSSLAMLKFKLLFIFLILKKMIPYFYVFISTMTHEMICQVDN